MAQCLSPIKIVNPHYVKLSGSKVQALRDWGARADLYLIVPCGRCLHCLKRRGSEWRRRMLDEYRYMPRDARSRVRFVTLSVSPKYYRFVKSHPKRAIRLFLDRYRKRFGHSPRHWIINEYGDSNGRLHFHGIFFDNEILRHELESVWQYGIVRSSRLRGSAAISYISTYVTKFLDKFIIDKSEKQFILCSPGIGKAYCDDPDNVSWHHSDGQLRLYSLDCRGYLVSLPRYYRNKIFTESELRTLHWRWVSSLGELPDHWQLGSRRFDNFWSYLVAAVDVGCMPLLLDDQFYTLFYGKEQNS